ncbi:glycosyltransferase [Nonomuraea dietziae]|uniref:Glycosyltransferase involved in cell wall biosynthesis n=1 Tax=Nonomuraea dietziae TaxID=65515 RepID=A0A7W5VEQ3_9ACTN|nr:glycosyltransferase [Nonomuraea dietziae]MBB3730105.1 glycosyltransferase involved in cell wall biosynthesis [Nonomuraea dietziae]
MKVLHVITGLAAGGAEQQLRAQLPYMRADCEVAVLTGSGVVAEAIEASGVPVHRVDMRGNRDLRALGRLARLMRAGRYEVVHTHLYRACVYGRLAARLANVPAIVATEHSIGKELIEGRRITRPVRALYLASELLGHVTVAVSPTVADRLATWGIPRSRIVVIANGVDARAFRYDPRLRERTRDALGLPREAFVVGGVGRLEPGKRFDLLVEAMLGLDDTFLLLVGAGSRRLQLENLARALGVDRRVIFAGESPDTRAMLSAMDVLAAPSQEETFGLAIVEALAAGLPVLYDTCPAVDDLPRDAAPGARRVTPGRLGAELKEMASTRPSRLTPPGAVRLYDIRHQVDQLEALYRRLLGAPGNEERR